MLSCCIRFRVDVMIDCSVHCPVPTLGELHPYLSRHWQDFLGAMGFSQPNGVGYSHPKWSTFAIDRTVVTLDRVRRDALARADLAIIGCYYGLESVVHPYLARDLATAVNRWLQE